jgi:SpoIID/LytB domain protein
VVHRIMKARVLTCVAALAAAPATADAAGRFTVRGAGYGHGVGMSQYGAYGYANHGWTYDDILAHYYTGTALGRSGGQTVRVLLQASVSRASFSGARSAGRRRLSPGRTYYVRQDRGRVQVVTAGGKVLARTRGTMVVRPASGILSLGGIGSYRDNLEFRTSGIFGVQAVNAVGLESYVRGVVARESPASWPAEALKAQAVAARTYAITTSKAGNGFDQYPDTRSQVYGGVAAETATTDAAVRGTRGRVVTYRGEPVVTYFFSTSGGRTENVENSFSGASPAPWLKSVKDPYDGASPKHRWGPYRWTMDETAAKLSGYVKGRFKGIEVVQRGRSPRIVSADVVGSGGRTRVSGATLRAELGLYDTWAYFSSIRARSAPKAEVDRAALRGMDPSARAAADSGRRLIGEVSPAVRGGNVTVQRHTSRGWVTLGTAGTDAQGRYAYTVDRAGRYRVRFLADVGPTVRVR